ncbi:MAG: Imm63 family immunity protein [Mucilaginibacter sp.]|uniref:Imm63 family immunity protein n=1 Tax=Mucilaginibacter sp. TaxID=1882438 RepID=UPI0031B50E84
MIISLACIKKMVDELALKIQAPETLLPAYGTYFEEAQPYIDIDHNGQLYLLANERGNEIYRYLALDLDDLLYHVFDSVTLSMATKYELADRVAGQDSRRIWFVEQERLLGMLNVKWQLKKQQNHTQILIGYPFDDWARDRVAYYQKLISQRMHSGEEWLVACEKYPWPNKQSTTN